MKKATLIFGVFALVFSANAQMKSSVKPNKANRGIEKKVFISHNTNRAAGDTLMYMPLPETFVNPTDNAGFTIETLDADGFPTNNANVPMGFGNVYTTDSTTTNGDPVQYNFYHPWETPAPLGTDTAFYWWATSWFNPPGIADNWLMFGPITIPAGGATLSWYDRTNRWKDGYEVKVSSGFSSPLDIGDFTGAAIYTIADDGFPSDTWAIDTTWELHSVAIPATFNGQQIAFAFHHNSNDMDVLRIDEIVVEEGLTVGVNEFVNGVSFGQNSPNPFNKNTAILYELENSANVTLNVFDVTGKLVAKQNEGEKASGKNVIKFNAENLSAGAYYYSLKVGNNVTSSKKMIIIK